MRQKVLFSRFLMNHFTFRCIQKRKSCIGSCQLSQRLACWNWRCGLTTANRSSCPMRLWWKSRLNQRTMYRNTGLAGGPSASAVSCVEDIECLHCPARCKESRNLYQIEETTTGAQWRRQDLLRGGAKLERVMRHVMGHSRLTSGPVQQLL